MCHQVVTELSKLKVGKAAKDAKSAEDGQQEDGGHGPVDGQGDPAVEASPGPDGEGQADADFLRLEAAGGRGVDDPCSRKHRSSARRTCAVWRCT